MNLKDTIAWFDEVAAQRPLHRTHREDRQTLYDPVQVTGWRVHAQSALEAAFPAGHAVRARWTAEAIKVAAVTGIYEVHVDELVAVFVAARDLLKAGRLVGLVESVQAETVAEVLEQADALIAKDHRVAAAVLAGGALETHLRHLCQKHGLTWVGDGSIAKYDGAIAQARNAGNEVYSATDTKAVGTWGGYRNDAAHDPTAFRRSGDEVRLMIEGIRQFVARTT